MMHTQLVDQVQSTCTEFCAALTQDEISKFVRYTRYLELQPHQILADIGAVGESFFMVVGGVIRLFQVDGEQTFLVGHIGAGGLVGEMSFFDRRPRTVRLVAGDEGAQLLEINRRMYNRMRIEESYVSTNLLEFVIRSLDVLVRELSEQNAYLHKQTAVQLT